ncbi:MAG: DUF6265 family protein [Bacteroidota bacterium]
MKTYFTIVLGLLTLVSQAQNTLKFDSEKGSPPATLEDISWISGYWKGQGLGGITDEFWSPPVGNSMMCTFKLVINNKVKFYELVTMVEEEGTLIKRLRHFTPKLVGWEEKDKPLEFKLVRIEDNRVYFDGFTYEKVNDNQMNIYVVLGDGKGSNKEMKFVYTKEKM